MTTLVGIKNCDSVKKARKWLEANAINYTFHDLREQGVERASLEQWLDAVGLELLLNRRSTTWKQLSEAERSDVDRDKALTLMLANPTLIKRPVLIAGKVIHVGFKNTEYKSIFAQ
jgi:arsenate reductase (glutaredoxin)